MARIVLVCPVKPGVRSGNTVTANRWARMLRDLGHRVRIIRELSNERFDLLVALHATKSAPSVERGRKRPGSKIVVALSGTDLYQDLPRLAAPRRSLDLADRIVVLQPLALRALSPRWRDKAVVLLQSVRMPKPLDRPRARTFDIVVLGHLRAVKDPLRAAYAARLLPESSRGRILHAGSALDPSWRRRARAEMRRNPRYVWLGEVPAWRARRLVARSRLVVLSSRSEGGANAISEAIVAGVPVLASRVPGNLGLLGAEYPGYFPVGNEVALARLLARVEMDRGFERELRRRVRALAPRFHPRREIAAWRALLKQLGL